MEWDESFRDLLKTNICEVTFDKVNGERRVMNATLSPRFIERFDTAERKTSRSKAENPDVLAVFDTDKKDWRSFRKDSLVKIYALASDFAV